MDSSLSVEISSGILLWLGMIFLFFFFWLVILLLSEVANYNPGYLLTETFKHFLFMSLRDVFHFRILIDVLSSGQLSLRNVPQLQP